MRLTVALAIIYGTLSVLSVAYFLHAHREVMAGRVGTPRQRQVHEMGWPVLAPCVIILAVIPVGLLLYLGGFAYGALGGRQK